MKKRKVLSIVSVLLICWSLPGWTDVPLDSDAGAAQYASMCAGCHGTTGSGGAAPELMGCDPCESISDLYFKIETTMPKGNASACEGSCSENTAAYIFEIFNGNTKYTAYIPHITGDFADWIDYLQIDNNGSDMSTVHIAIYSGESIVYSGFQAVPGRGEVTPPIDLKSYNASAETGIITFYDLNYNFRLTTVNNGGGIAEFSLSRDLYANAGFYFTDFQGTSLSGSIVNKGLAVANMTDESVSVVLHAVGSGEILSSTDPIPIGPFQRIFGTHVSWFPALTIDQVKKIIAVTPTPALAGIVIASDQDLSHLLFTPGAEVSSFPD